MCHFVPISLPNLVHWHFLFKINTVSSMLRDVKVLYTPCVQNGGLFNIFKNKYINYIITLDEGCS